MTATNVDLTHFSGLTEYTRHHNGHRPHRSLGQQPPNPSPQVIDLVTARVHRRPIPGRLINEYSQAA
jgi:putative transposase